MSVNMDTLNPGIRATVGFLRKHGFDTCDSGDGVTHEHDCDREHPYVVMRVADSRMLLAETRRLVALLVTVGVDVYPQSMVPVPCIQATYDPADDSAFLDLMHVNDALLSERACDAFVAYCNEHGLIPTALS